MHQVHATTASHHHHHQQQHPAQAVKRLAAGLNQSANRVRDVVLMSLRPLVVHHEVLVFYAVFKCDM
jgi:hypothetical protein